MEKIDKMAVFRGTNYFRVDDATVAMGLMGRTYAFNAAIQGCGAKIVKLPGFGNSYFLSEEDALRVEANLKNYDDYGERVDASTGQLVSKVGEGQSIETNQISSQQMAINSSASQPQYNTKDPTPNQHLNPNQNSTTPNQMNSMSNENEQISSEIYSKDGINGGSGSNNSSGGNS